MALYSFEGISPVIHPTAYIHPQACIIGDVFIDANCYIGPFASLRADFSRIIIQEGVNMQDSCTIHGYSGQDCILESNSHIGHGAVIHSAIIKKNALIGMQALIMDLVEVGVNSIVGAKSLVTTGFKVPDNTLVVGTPAKIIKTLNENAILNKKNATRQYHNLAQRSIAGLKEIALAQTIQENATPTANSPRVNWENIPIFTTKN